MRFMALVFAGMLAVCVVDSQASAAKAAGYYQGAGACHGAAYCSYRAKKVHRKAHS